MSGLASNFFSRVNTSLKSQISGLAKITSKITNSINNAMQKVQTKITTFIRTLISKPRSKKDYIEISGIYLAKRLVFLVILSSAALIFIFYSFVVPRCEGYLWYAKLPISSDKAQQITGNKVKLYDVDNKLIYQGAVSSGKPKGFGVQYDQNGNLKYRGEFNFGMYSGKGEIYNPLGNVLYSGTFENNRYEGSGQLFNTSGSLTYSGNFEKGEKSGKGTEYDPKTGMKKYYGGFVNGKYEGNGVLYSSGTEIISYEGSFKNGFFDGMGRKFSSGHLLYSGSFSNGKYNGEGFLYNLASGSVIYAGKFENGEYNGTGKLYDEKTANLSYEGEFSNGKKNGSGILYDKLGISVFTGDFRDDGIDFISYFGKGLDDIREKFGNENKQIASDDKILLLNSPIDSVLIFEKEQDDKYKFNRVIIGKKFDFMGLRDSEPIKRRTILGQPYSSTELSINDYQHKAFSSLGLSALYDNVIYSNKYVFENYFIRLFFSSDKQNVEAVEVGAL